MNGDPISIVVVDDHPMFREAVVRAIRSREGMRVVAEVGSGHEAIDAVRREHPAVCVLDLNLPDLSGRQVLETIMSESDDTRVLVLSGSYDSDAVYALIEIGASGFKLKTAGPEELGEAIAAVARGDTVIPPEVHGDLAQQIRAHRIEEAALSDRELEILRLVAGGLAAGEIAEQMHLAESTVKTHLTRIYDKLGVSERAAAVAAAIRRGLIE